MHADLNFDSCMIFVHRTAEEIPISSKKTNAKPKKADKQAPVALPEQTVECAVTSGAYKHEPEAATFGEKEQSYLQVNVTKKEILRK